MNDEDDFLKVESAADDAILFVIGLWAVIVLLILTFFGYFG